MWCQIWAEWEPLKVSFHVWHIHHIKSQWSLISRYGHLRNLSAEIWSPRHLTFLVNLIWACPKNPFCLHFPIIPGGLITCGQKELLNSHFYLIIGYLDISIRPHNLFVSIVSGSLIRESLCLAHRFRKGLEVVVKLHGWHSLDTFIKNGGLA